MSERSELPDQHRANDEVWILGATGRTGTGVARRLAAAGVPLALVGRGAARLEALADELRAGGVDAGRRDGAGSGDRVAGAVTGVGGGRVRVVVGELGEVLGLVGREGPRVVVNTVGPFTETAPRVVDALPPGTHYVDVSNEFTAVEVVMARAEQAVERGQVLVAAAGFGVLATEAAAIRATEGREPAEFVRVDALASVALEEGVMGAALAGSVVEAVSFGGREVRDGRVVHARVAGRPESFTTPDGERLRTVSGASGELLAAWRVTDARNVVGASALVPTGPVARTVIPLLSLLFRVPGVAGFAAGRIARVKFRAQARPRVHSWARAHARWADGETREVWLRADDAMDFTVASIAEVASRLRHGDGKPGAHTPAALFGPELAEAAGASFIRTV